MNSQFQKLSIMKNLKTTLLALTLLAGTALLSSCLKNKDNNTGQPISALMVVNGFSGTASADFYLNGVRVNNQPINYAINTAYFNIYPGLRRISATKGGTENILVDQSYSFGSGNYFSVFIAPKSELAADADSAVFVVTKDSLVAPETGKASIRFVNLTPGTHKLDIKVKDAATPLFSNKGFKAVTDFVSVTPNETYILEITETGSSTVKYQLAPFAVQSGKIYTVYSNGLWDGTSASAFGAKVIIH